LEQIALKRFRKEIGKHFFRGAIHDGDVLGLGTVLHKEILDVDVLGLLSARCSTVLFKANGTLVISSYPCSAKNILAQMTLGK
jgi:hypothetical protein